MSDDKKPKKDLRARLGRTISPNTAGAPAPIAPPGAAPGRASVPPPPVAAPGPASIPAPPGGLVPPPVIAPGNPFASPGIVPPFGKPQSVPPKAAAPDPFAAGPSSAGPQEVRLVFDDKAVEDIEVGRKNTGRTAMLVGVCILLGGGLGYGVASTNDRNRIYNDIVDDGKSIAESVNTASPVILDVQAKVDRLAAAALGEGGQPRVEYETIAALQALENPFPAGIFNRRKYGLFNAEAVDALFQYYDHVQRLWAALQRLAVSTSQQRRAELDRTATATGERANALYGLVPQSTDDGIKGVLVFVQLQPSGKALVRPSQSQPGRELDLFTADTEVGSGANTVILIDGRQSAGVLSEQRGAFGTYAADLLALKRLVTETVELQGRVTTALAEIARLEHSFAF
jgi:hypothetical protein